MIEITLNNRKREVPATTTLAGLVEEFLAELRLGPEMVSVAVNGTIVPRQEWGGRVLADGDVVEYLMFMGGGMPR